MSMDTPLLLITWRRPDTLLQVIDAIRPAAPSRLFVACDGPNPERLGEAEKVADTRAVISNQINWPCQIQYLYSDVNQGCRLGVSRAITWFFHHVEEGIILEDDCLPHPDFLRFCQESLYLYRQNTRIWQVCGTNSIESFACNQGESHFFSRYGPIWGWATWRRAWNFHDSTLNDWPRMRLKANTVYSDKFELSQKLRIGGKLYAGLIDTWDYQWAIIKAFNGGLNIVPPVNLIQNIGLGPDATHTKDSEARVPVINCDRRIEFPLSVASLVLANHAYDRLYCKKYFHPKSILRRLLGRIHGITRCLV